MHTAMIRNPAAPHVCHLHERPRDGYPACRAGGSVSKRRAGRGTPLSSLQDFLQEGLCLPLRAVRAPLQTADGNLQEGLCLEMQSLCPQTPLIEHRMR